MTTLRYWHITRNIVRCKLDTPAQKITIRPNSHFSEIRYNRNEWNMSATIACTSEIHIGDESAIVQWENGLVKTSGDLEIEIKKVRP